MPIEGLNCHPFDACANCGEPFDPDVRYPVKTHEDPNGELELYSFCDEGCQAAWNDER